jgi:hypothetical protein
LRLRQVCLVASDLATEASKIGRILGIDVCYRDPNVARYGLENVLFPVGTDFIEIVSPTRPGTAAGRFLERTGGRFGYMVILDCNDPLSRKAHCESIGARTANLIRHDNYVGAQLHPKDTGGAMIEFNRTEGGEDTLGPYAPAGPAWQKSIRRDTTTRMLGVDVECADPDSFSARWADILQRPVSRVKDNRRIQLESGSIRFLPGSVPHAAMAGIEVEVVDRERVVRVARDLDCVDAHGDVQVCGIRVRLKEAG